MELLSGGTLRKKLEEGRKFTDAEASVIMNGILQAVAYLHRKEIIHRDLKPDNIMFESDELSSVKIIDFGLSAKFEDTPKNDTVEGDAGTALYMAPE